MIIEKTVEKDLGVACQLRIYAKVAFHFISLFSSKIVETLAAQNEPDILDDFLATFSHQVTQCIWRKR